VTAEYLTSMKARKALLSLFAPAVPADALQALVPTGAVPGPARFPRVEL
jgi:hypothetical protein